MDWHAGEASTVVLYYVEYDTHRPTLALVRYWNLKKIKKRRVGVGTPLVLCWIWPREANTTILYGVQHDWKRQTLPSYVKVRFTQSDKHCCTVLWRWVWLRGILSCRVVLNTHWGKHCCLVLCWIRPRGKVRWKHVKRWWKGCLDVVGMNSDVTEIKEKTTTKNWSVGFCTDFGFCPVGSCSAGGLLPPYLARYIQRKQLTHFLSRQEPDV